MLNAFFQKTVRIGLALLIAAYRCMRTAFLLQTTCKYWPSCSVYARDALKEHGPLKGARLSLARITRCHSGAQGGVDPVPSGRG